MHRLKEGGAYFKERPIIHLKFQNFEISNYQLFSYYFYKLFLSSYTCSIGVLDYLWLDYGPISNKCRILRCDT